MNQASITSYEDSQLFSHQMSLSEEDLADFMPPTKVCWTTYVNGEICGKIHEIPNDSYQVIYEGLLDHFDSQPNYGEGWEGMANHASDMTGLDRIVFEDCYQGSGAIQRPSMNVPNIGKARKIDRLAKELGCTLSEAEDLTDFWGIIDDSKKLWPEFKRWIKARSVKVGLEYFENLAGALVDDTCHTNDKGFDLINDQPFYDRNPDGDHGDDEIVINSMEELEDAWQAMLERTPDQKENSPEIDPELFQNFLDRNSFETPDGKVHIDKPFGTPNVFRYVNINDDPGEAPEFDPNKYSSIGSRQPRWTRYCKILRVIETARMDVVNKFAQAKGFGKFAWMSYRETSLFWLLVKQRQNQLSVVKKQYIDRLLANMTHVEHTTLTMIRNCKSIRQAKYYWYLIYRAQDGEINLGRKGFVLYVLKPALNDRQIEILRNNPVSQESEEDPFFAEDFDSYMDSLLAAMSA